ncbi:MAG: hypothetical protein ACHQAU_04910 [Gammaproteobacteria bacterium]
MLSSTSSSNQRLPHLAWGPILGVALLALLVWVKAMETGLGLRGFKAGMVDSESLWLKQRARADSLGKDALVLVGDSRMQLDIDQNVLRLDTGLEPVQLALDGTPFLSVFKGVASDPGITGTVLVDFAESPLLGPQSTDTGSDYESAAYRLRQQHDIPDFLTVDASMSGWLHGALRSYAEGGQPFSALTLRLLQPNATPQYTVMQPDRSMLADYRRVTMPDFYYQRVFRNLGERMDIPPGTRVAEVNAQLDKQMAALEPVADRYFRDHIRGIAAMAAAITARGGRVIIVIFPKSGYVKEIDDRLYPRQQFWDLFAAGVGTQTLNSEDDPVLRGFICPDGSHLDYRQRASFTAALVNALNLRQKDHTASH